MRWRSKWISFGFIAMIALNGAVHSANNERNPVRTHPRAIGNVQQIIIKLHLTAASPSVSEVQIKRMASRHQLTLRAYQSLTQEIYVLKVSYANGTTLEEQLAQLRADSEVEYAEPNARRYVHSVPNDALYTEQWYFQPNSASAPSAVDQESAWTTTQGDPGLIIADIDTGVRFDHPDLLQSGAGGRLLPGYCFISDSFVANNTTCPGADASDPGDWVTSSDLSQSECSNQQTSYSSWHGTRVAGVLGAIANNSLGIAGATWQPRILPVRALGKCGGIDSDIITAILWAAGIEVSGAATNSNPARIINLSIGGSGSCPQSYQDAINQVVALGVLVVASAGNEGGPVDAPANCAGVAGIAGLRHAGTKVGYSSLGPQVALGAPAGNCVNTGAEQPCLYSIITATNLGVDVPGANDYTGLYDCDSSTGNFAGCQIIGNQYRTTNLGTSFSAPIVSGIAALMSSVNSNLSPCTLLARLQEGATSYPQSSVGETSQPPLCHVPANLNDIQTSECICTRDAQTCGAGMANASGALKAAFRPIAAIATPASISAGQSVTLDASGSAAASSRTLTYAWSQVQGVSLILAQASSAKAVVTLPACGVATLEVIVTDNSGAQDTATVVITPQTVSTTVPAIATMTASCPLTHSPVLVGVCPASAQTQANGGSQVFSATLANTPTSTVTWEVNGIAGGNSTAGTITSSGVYTAPANVPSPATVTVTAVSTADSSASASASVTVTQPPSSGGGAIDSAYLGALLSVVLFRLLILRGGSMRR